MIPYLFLFDYDGTIADTAALSPNGINVAEAYKKSIQAVFGERALKKYECNGGLRNRAPSEVVYELLDASEELRSHLIANARRFYSEENDRLKQIVPVGKGVNIDSWDTRNIEQLLTEILVRQKLEYLLREVGKPLQGEQGLWPKPMHGFMDFWNALYSCRSNAEYKYSTAIVSSGHDEFINRTFRLWNLPLPDYMVTEDDIRGMIYPKELSRRFKPGQLQMALVHRAWLRSIDIGAYDPIAILESRKRMVYFGDHEEKDGGLARGTRIIFGHYLQGNQYSQMFSYDRENRVVTFTNWQSMIPCLLNDDIFKKNRTFDEVFFNGHIHVERERLSKSAERN